jgi:hypothetical protein
MKNRSRGMSRTITEPCILCAPRAPDSGALQRLVRPGGVRPASSAGPRVAALARETRLAWPISADAPPHETTVSGGGGRCGRYHCTRQYQYGSGKR